MKGKFTRRAQRRADHRAIADRLANQHRRDELRREIAATDAQAVDLAALAGKVHDRLEQRDAAEAAELMAQALQLNEVRAASRKCPSQVASA